MNTFIERCEESMVDILLKANFKEVKFKRESDGSSMELKSRKFEKDSGEVLAYAHIYSDSIRFGITDVPGDVSYILEYWKNKHRFEQPITDNDISAIIDEIHRSMMSIVKSIPETEYVDKFVDLVDSIINVDNLRNVSTAKVYNYFGSSEYMLNPPHVSKKLNGRKLTVIIIGERIMPDEIPELVKVNRELLDHKLP